VSSAAATDSDRPVVLFDLWRPRLSLHPVTVGVVDVGLRRASGQLDDTPISTVPTGVSEVDPNGHGTAVLSLIAADDDGRGVNGGASRLLGDALRVVFSPMGRQTAVALVAVEKVIDAGASVVNLSFGSGPFGAKDDVAALAWRRLMQRHAGVTFVAAAPNAPIHLLEWNDAPAGMGLDNLITVGGFDACTPHTPRGAYGRVIDLGAPAGGVAAAAPNGEVTLVSGSSFAAPQVTSVIAVLRALDPTLSPAHLRARLLAGADPGPEALGGRMLNVARPLVTAALAQLPDVAADLRTAVGDADGRANLDAVVAHTCAPDPMAVYCRSLGALIAMVPHLVDGCHVVLHDPALVPGLGCRVDMECLDGRRFSRVLGQGELPR